MLTTRIQRMVILAGIFSLLAAYVGLWLRFMNDPVERTGSDFIGFYSIGRIAQEQGPAYVYDPALQQQIQQEVVGFELAPGQVLINQHLPFLIPILQSLVSQDYVASFHRWNILMLLLYIIGIVLLSSLLKSRGLDRGMILQTSLGCLLFYPLFFSFLNGQDTAIAFLGLSIWVFGLMTGRDMLAGLGLSLVTVRPHIAIVMAIPMFFRRRKVFWGFAIGSGILGLISVALLGMQGTRQFIDILFISAEGQWYGLNEEHMFNLIGLLLRILPWLSKDTIHIIGWVTYAATIIGLCNPRRNNPELKTGGFGLFVIAALFVAPHLHYHDLTLLLIPIYELILTSTETDDNKKLRMIALPVILSFVLLLGNISAVLQYTSPYLIMLGLAAYPFLQDRNLSHN